VPPPASVPSLAQALSETVTTQLSDNSTTNNLSTALGKGKRICTQHPLSNFVSYLIYHLSFIYFFFGLMHDSLECVRNTVYSRLGSGDAGGDDDLRA